MPRPLLFCNIGWMRAYQGQTSTDKIIGGGHYVQIQERGHEVCNFVAARGKVFGHVQPVGTQIKIERLGAPRKAEELPGVDVVWTAHRPGGDTVIVGWYLDATVHRHAQDLAPPTALHRKNGIDSFRVEAKASNATLLAPGQRTEVVPRGKGGLGQSNVWYAEAAPAPWLMRVRGLIAGGVATAPRRGKRPPPDTFQNAQVERIAMTCAWTNYVDQGYTLTDVSKENRGWDLEASSGSLTLRIEVKGLSGSAAHVELTPNEYKAFREHALTYRLCVVTECLTKPALFVCAFNVASDGWIIEAGAKLTTVTIKERTAATITLA